MDTYEIAGQLETASLGETLDRLALLAQRRRLLFFFGAGFSRAYPSLNPLVDARCGLPGLRPLLVDIIRKGCSDDPHGLVAASLNKDPLEVILDQLALAIGDTAFDFLDLLGTAPDGLAAGPNYNHYCLALLAKAGYCNNFFTVNFDTLVEEAFTALGAGDLIVPEERGDEARLYALASTARHRSAAHLFKLHGTLSAKLNLLTTIEVMGLGLPHYKERLLRELLGAHACLFMGYRAGDRDIFPVLSTLPRSCEVFWFDVSLGSGDLKRLSKLLLPRPHRIIVSPTLPPVLQALLGRLDIDDRVSLHHLGVTSLAELEAKEDAAVPMKALRLRAFAEDFRERAVFSEVSTLMMSSALALSPEGVEMREKLFKSLNPQAMPTTLRYAYSAQLAERQWGMGQFRAAVATRHKALRHLHESGLPVRGQKRETIEQHIRTGRDYLALARALVGHRRRLLYTVLGAAYFVLAAVKLLAFWHQLTVIERGRLSVMLAVRPASALHKGVEKRLLRELRRWVKLRGEKRFPAQRSLMLRAQAAAAEWLYRRCLLSPALTHGWKTLAMRSLAEVLMHRTGTCPPEAVRLVAGARIGEDERSEFGTHEALLLLYSGAFDAAQEVLDHTFRYYQYEARRYLSGMAKTLLMQALCFALQNKRGAVSATLCSYESLQKESYAKTSDDKAES